MKKITDKLEVIGKAVMNYVKTMPMFDRGLYAGLVAGTVLGCLL